MSNQGRARWVGVGNMLPDKRGSLCINSYAGKTVFGAFQTLPHCQNCANAVLIRALPILGSTV